MKDFLINYGQADRAWAEWVAWQLGNSGYTTLFHALNSHTNVTFVSDGQQAAGHTIVLLSPALLDAPDIECSWADAGDPTGAGRKLILVRVKKVDPPEVLKTRATIDLVDLEEQEASDRLLQQINIEQAKRKSPIKLPGAAKQFDAPRPPFPDTLPPIWNIPTCRNPNFNGRKANLSTLADEFNSAHQSTPIQTIKGRGGIGKTQVALEYAYRYSNNYQAIWWIRAGNEETLAGDYTAFAAAANLKEKHAQKERVIIDAVRGWLGRHHKWLFIFDNVKNPEAVRDYLPGGATGHVLITSRHQTWEKLCPSLGLEIWSQASSVDYLLKRAKNSNPSGARGVAETVGGLPLALEQAAAYIDASGIAFSDYLKSYRTRHDELWKNKKLPLNYPDTVGTTISLCIEKVQEETPVGLSMLNLCSFLAAEEIPCSMVAIAGEYMPEAVSALFNESSVLQKGINVLKRYSLVAAQSDSLSMHRLVQVAVQDRMQKSEKKMWSEIALRTVTDVFPEEGYCHPERWPECKAMLSHGTVASTQAHDHQAALDAAADILNRIGAYLHARASFSGAGRLFRRSLGILEAQGEDDRPDAAVVINNLALLYQDQGRYAQAETLFRRALQILEAQLGNVHPAVAACLNNLALLLRDRCAYADAEALLRRALEIHETQGEGNPPGDAGVISNLALLYQDQGRYAQAETLFRRAYQILEAQLGNVHPEVAVSLNDLAGSLQDQDKVAEAETLYRRALEIFEAPLGENHQAVADCLHCLASLLHDQDKHAEAETLYRRALEIFETLLGNVHPTVAICLNNLAISLQDQSRYDQAETLYRRALKIRETQLGADHPAVATCLNNLASLYQDQGKSDRAVTLYRQALEILEAQLGSDHPDVAVSANNLTELLQGRDKLKAAEDLSGKAPA